MNGTGDHRPYHRVAAGPMIHHDGAVTRGPVSYFPHREHALVVPDDGLVLHQDPPGIGGPVQRRDGGHRPREQDECGDNDDKDRNEDPFFPLRR